MYRASRAKRCVQACLAASAVTAGIGLIAGSAAAADSCPNAAVRAQQQVTALPDCRAYELVNPATDDVGEVNRVPFSADDGNTLAYVSVIPGDDALGGGVNAISVARRTTGGWRSVSADPVSRGAIYQLTGVTSPVAFSPDFGKALLTTTLPAVDGDVNGLPDFFRVDVGLGTATWMTPGLDTFSQVAAGATPNLDRIVFLKPDGSTPRSGLYLNDGGSTSELLSLYPTDINGGAPLGIGEMQPAGPSYARGLNVGNGSTSPFVERGGPHGVSDDARRVYFAHLSQAGSELFVRDLAHAPARTVAVSISSRAGDVGTVYDGRFISASHNGSVAYFASAVQLTDAATPGGGIYRFDLASETVTQITPAGDPAGVSVFSAITSDDQSHIYFTSDSALAAGAQAGDTNAYVWTSAGGVRFISKVASADPAAPDVMDKFVRVTPEGRFALLAAAASVNGAPNNGKRALYRYDDVNGQVTCVSCRPDGSPSQGVAEIDGQSFGQPAASLSRNRGLTLDGRVVFVSTDRLTATDQTFARDVYMYYNGTVSLLTGGGGDSDSFVGDVSDDGRTVSVITRAALVAADRDADEYDVYAVRVDGGFLAAPPEPSPCRGDDCQDAVPPDVVDPSPPKARVVGNAPVPKAVKKLGVPRLTSAQRSTLARTGKVFISARVAGGGTLTVRGRGRIGGSAKTLGTARQAILKRSETTVKVTFKLSQAARRELSRRHRLSMTLQARLSGLSKAVTMTVNLTRAPR
jgi:hypothetical protein